MRFVDSKRRTHWGWILLGIGMIAFLFFGFCEFQPTPQREQKTIVFEAD